jgi:hypothetical protein
MFPVHNSITRHKLYLSPLVSQPYGCGTFGNYI